MELVTGILKQTCCGHSQKTLGWFDLSAFSLWRKGKFVRSLWSPSSLSDYIKRRWETQLGCPSDRAWVSQGVLRSVYYLFSGTRAPVCSCSELSSSLTSWVRRISSVVHHCLLSLGWTGNSLGLSQKSQMAQMRHSGSRMTLHGSGRP